MAKISRLPVGLLDFLGLKNLGRNPDELALTVVPMLDMRDFYLADRWTNVVETGLSAAGTANTSTVTRVPAGEIWWIKQYQVSTSPLGAGQTLRLQAFASLPGAASASQFTGELDQAAQATVGEICRASVRDFLAIGGTQFGFTPLQNVAGPVPNISASWTYVPFLR